MSSGAASNPSFGELLRSIRSSRNLFQVDVELLSREIAPREACPNFIVSNCRLSAIENGHALPGPGKLLALAEIYGLTSKQLTKLWSTIKPRWSSTAEDQGDD